MQKMRMYTKTQQLNLSDIQVRTAAFSSILADVPLSLIKVGTYPHVWRRLLTGEGSKLMAPRVEVGPDRHVLARIREACLAVVRLLKRARHARKLGGSKCIRVLSLESGRLSELIHKSHST